MIRDLLAHRDLLWLLVLREIRVRYARTVMGVAWAAAVPLVLAALFASLGFARLVDGGSPFAEVPFSAFALCGLVPWQAFAGTLATATGSLVNSRDLLRKSAFPREVIPLSRVLAGLPDMAVGFGVVLALVAWECPAGSLGWACLGLLPVVVLQIIFTAGLGLGLSVANLFYRDVQYLLQVGLLVLMFASAVVVPIEGLSVRAQSVLQWNPLAAYMAAYRDSLLLGSWPWEAPTLRLAVATVGAFASLAIGVAVFRASSRRLAEEA
jgi:ABC-type polysaccharide/polyol phosphate export permease